MKFLSPRFKRLRIAGAGQFVDGVLEVDDEAAIKRVQAVAERYGVHAVLDGDGPFDPSARDRDTVNKYLATADETERVRVLDAEAAGKARVTILQGPHGVSLGEPAIPPQTMREVDDRIDGEDAFIPVDDESAQA